MHLGVDFDNTIVCYDALFHRVGLEKGLISAEVPASKSEVRNYLRRAGREDAWTEMQGYVYGVRMSEAEPYPGVKEFFQSCRAACIEVSIISHKTRHPYVGEPHDLHQTAQAWLEAQGFFDPGQMGLERVRVFFELTKSAKLDRIRLCGCTHFIDDLPEFLLEPDFLTTVQRILFDPNDHYSDAPGYTRVKAWRELRDWLIQTDSIEFDSFLQAVDPFLRRHGVAGDYQCKPMPGGANNRVYRVSHPPGDLVLKRYFQSSHDTRDRFGVEHAFYGWLGSQGIRRTPAPRGWCAENRWGLFDFVPGRKLRPLEVNAARVGEALAFLEEINAHRTLPTAQALPIASEACFSLEEHLACVDRRLERLTRISGENVVDQQARALVQEHLAPGWQRIRAGIIHAAPGSGFVLESPIPQHWRCLSPSDFGFHNAIVAPDQRLRFLDFEYAGWDDPAKLACDFFCQPELPAGLAHWDDFLARLGQQLNGEAALARRARLLLPAYQIKWCCIMLNEFMRGDEARRTFAVGAVLSAERKAGQLAKASQSLARTLEMCGCQSLTISLQ